jgi:predicted AlkP superfamily pyrophosphatase or phosphodiesterase
MNSILRIFLLLVLAAFTAACASTPPAKAPPARAPVLLISLDGFRPDYLKRGVTPTLSQLAANGASVPEGMRPAFPSMTFPNHYTLVTGLPPGRHGLVNNTMTDPAIPNVLFSLGNRAAVIDRRWWDQATPLWVSAERQGLKSATMFWPGSESDIQGVRPRDWKVYDYNLPAATRVNTVLEWLDRPAETRPDFITLYFETVDSAGHRHGPDSDETNAAIAALDKALGDLIAGLKQRDLIDRINLVIVADHGMAAIAPERVVFIDDMVDLAALAPANYAGPFVGFTPAPGREADVAAALAKPRAHVQCWPKADLPARFAYNAHVRIPPFICLAETGWWMATRATFATTPPRGGAHGYDPIDPQMAALFIAHGPAFKPGATLAPFENVDVYPLLVQLLAITPEDHAGDKKTTAPALK